MKFERFIRNLSSLVAAVVVYLIAVGMYLSFKGFVSDGKGGFVLAPEAYAQEPAQQVKILPADLVLPEKYVIGDATAPITIYEYSSFGCFHCADFHLQTLPLIKKKYIDKGIVRVAFVPFPIDKPSMSAALLAECVDKNKYFSFAEVLFKKQREWGLSRDPQKVLKQYAALSGLGQNKADACLHDDEVARSILEDRQNGITQLGIQGTPSFVIASKDEKMLYSGAFTLEYLDEIVSQRLPDEKGDEKVEGKDNEPENIEQPAADENKKVSEE